MRGKSLILALALVLIVSFVLASVAYIKNDRFKRFVDDDIIEDIFFPHAPTIHPSPPERRITIDEAFTLLSECHVRQVVYGRPDSIDGLFMLDDGSRGFLKEIPEPILIEKIKEFSSKCGSVEIKRLPEVYI